MTDSTRARLKKFAPRFCLAMLVYATGSVAPATGGDVLAAPEGTEAHKEPSFSRRGADARSFQFTLSVNSADPANPCVVVVPGSTLSKPVALTQGDAVSFVNSSSEVIELGFGRKKEDLKGIKKPAIFEELDWDDTYEMSPGEVKQFRIFKRAARGHVTFEFQGLKPCAGGGDSPGMTIFP